jgi:hypothetical protein
MSRATREPRFADPPPAAQPPERVSGRSLAAPRTRPEALFYLLTLLALYGGVVAVIALDSAGPTCGGAGCATFHPGIRLAAVVAAIGFVLLVALAIYLTRSYDRRTSAVAEQRRASARGWPLAWNYLAAGLIVPAAVRMLRRPRGSVTGGRAADRPDS